MLTLENLENTHTMKSNKIYAPKLLAFCGGGEGGGDSLHFSANIKRCPGQNVGLSWIYTPQSYPLPVKVSPAPIPVLLPGIGARTQCPPSPKP